MGRWSKALKDDLIASFKSDIPEDMLKNFYLKRNYIPQTPEEKQEFEEFSLITSAMALLIHVAEADRLVNEVERFRIVKDLAFQLEQRPFEYQKYKEKFGTDEVEIIAGLFSEMLKTYEAGNLDLNHTLKAIDMVYQNNPYKRYFLLRLCYYTALADRKMTEEEETVLQDLAKKLEIGEEKRIEIETEIKQELQR